MRGACDIEPRCNRLLGAHALIASIEGVAGNDRHTHFVAAGDPGTVEASAIQDETDVCDARNWGQCRH